MKSYAIGFLTCLCMVLLMGAVSLTKEKFREAQELIEELNVQKKNFDLYTDTRTLVMNVGEREVVLLSTPTKSIVTKIGTNFFQVFMSTM